MEWFRLYDPFIDCPKVVRLTREMRSYLVDVWCIASRQRVRGTLPCIEDVAVHFRVKPGRARQVVAKLKEAGFIDEDPITKALTVHDWNEWQRQSDDAAAVKKAQRSKQRPPDVHGHVRDSPPPRGCATETETDTDKEKDPPFNSPPRDEEPGTLGPKVDVPSGVAERVESTPEQIERVRAMAERVLNPLDGSGLWAGRCESFARIWNAEWVEEVIPMIASKLAAPGGPWLREGYATTILKDWARRGGPPPPDGTVMGDDSTWGRPRPQRQQTERQRKLARHAEAAYAAVEDDDGDSGGEAMGEAAAVPAHREDEGGRRARA